MVLGATVWSDGWVIDGVEPVCDPDGLVKSSWVAKSHLELGLGLQASNEAVQGRDGSCRIVGKLQEECLERFHIVANRGGLLDARPFVHDILNVVWRHECGSKSEVEIVPGGKLFVHPLVFEGEEPDCGVILQVGACKSNLVFFWDTSELNIVGH